MGIAKTDSVRVYCFNGHVAVSDADCYLSLAQAKALSEELACWVERIRAGRHPSTRLVFADGRRVTESTGKPEWIHI